jgi:uncharacterized protein (UPF0333 family)
MTKRLSLAYALLVVALVVVYAGCQSPPSAQQTGDRFTVRSAGEGADTIVRIVSDSYSGKCYAVVVLDNEGGVTSLGEVRCDSTPPAEKP